MQYDTLYQTSNVVNSGEISPNFNCPKDNIKPYIRQKPSLYRKLKSKFSDYLSSHQSSAKLILKNSTLKSIRASDYLTIDKNIPGITSSKLTPLLYKSMRKMDAKREKEQHKVAERSVVLMRTIEYTERMKEKKLREKYPNCDEKIIMIQMHVKRYIYKKLLINNINMFILHIQLYGIKKRKGKLYKKKVNNNNKRMVKYAFLKSKSKEKNIPIKENLKDQRRKNLNTNGDTSFSNSPQMVKKIRPEDDSFSSQNEAKIPSEKIRIDKENTYFREGNELNKNPKKCIGNLIEEKKNSMSKENENKKEKNQSKGNVSKSKKENIPINKNINKKGANLNNRLAITKNDNFNSNEDKGNNKGRKNKEKNTDDQKENKIHQYSVSQSSIDNFKLNKQRKNINANFNSIPNDEEIQKIIFIQSFFRGFLSKRNFDKTFGLIGSNRKSSKRKVNSKTIPKEKDKRKCKIILAEQGIESIQWINNNKNTIDKVTRLVITIKLIISSHKILDKLTTFRMLKEEFLPDEQSSTDTIEDNHLFSNERADKFINTFNLANVQIINGSFIISQNMKIKKPKDIRNISQSEDDGDEVISNQSGSF